VADPGLRHAIAAEILDVMSPEPIEVVRAAVDHFNRHDWAALERLLHPEVHAVDHQAPIGVASEMTNSAQYVKACRAWTEMFEGARVEVDDYADAGDQVVCSARYCGVGGLSGIAAEMRQFDVYRVVDGVIVEALVGFRSLDEAFASTRAERRAR
jgi:ketosteroid isomerase-like protein